VRVGACSRHHRLPPDRQANGAVRNSDRPINFFVYTRRGRLRATVNKLLHPPMVHLRTAAASGNGDHEVESIRTMFALEEAAAIGWRGDRSTG
jgi:hypothetical protein